MTVDVSSAPGAADFGALDAPFPVLRDTGRESQQSGERGFKADVSLSVEAESAESQDGIHGKPALEFAS